MQLMLQELLKFIDLLLKDCHREPVTDVTGVAIPIKFADSALKSMGIATLVLQSTANQNRSIASGNRSLILCALARNDTLLLGVRRTSNSSINNNFAF